MRFWRRWLSMGILATATLMAQTKWHHRYAEVNGVKLHYVEQGKGELILFLHGFPEFWYEWKDLIPEFAKDHHAVAPDMRGYNLSDAPAEVESYRVPVIVEDVRALAVKLKARRFVLVGHDWGGVIAWEDDKETVIRGRLDAYDRQTRPVLEYFRTAGRRVVEVNASDDSPEAVHRKICKMIESASSPS